MRLEGHRRRETAPSRLSIPEKLHWHHQKALDYNAFYNFDGPLDTPCIQINYDKAPGIYPDSGKYPICTLPMRGGRVRQTSARLSRYFYIVFSGDDRVHLCPGKNSDQIMRHDCDNPSCVNPLHLRIGSDSDNAIDAASRDRNPNAKLTVSDVREIRELYATGEYTQTYLASVYGVGTLCINYLINRRTWAHVH